ncbi:MULTISPECIES: hypothetical protein [Pseudomonas]|uniref:Uncharacterized protein n=1 Tax=Pseudomonas gingeri TaxID=117681 RepID=A0A7Y7WMU8_9PSED|nr:MULTISPECIES: hypothetical protein [Pseudomonas]NWB84233.1 hypothetical protein [Pseudomonas gingeri]
MAGFVANQALHFDAAGCIPTTRGTELDAIDPACQHVACKMAQLNGLPLEQAGSIAEIAQSDD